MQYGTAAGATDAAARRLGRQSLQQVAFMTGDQIVIVWGKVWHESAPDSWGSLYPRADARPKQVEPPR
jgi:hypothetical protein